MSDPILSAIEERRTVTHFRSDHDLSDDDIRELVGLAADGNWPQKPRRPAADITELV